MNFLKCERERLGFQQKDVFEKIGVNKGTLIRWESGKPIPSDKLTLLANMGFDVQYIITGVKNDLVLISNGAIGENALTIGFQRPWLEKKGVNIERLFLFNVSGDAMSPTLNAGDTLLVEGFIYREKTGSKVEIKQGLSSGENLAHDGIYLVRLDERQSIRRVQLMPSGAVVTSDNSSYKEATIKEDEINSMILGRVVWHAKDIG